MNNNVLIKKIKILSEDAEEALVHISDGVYECAAFCQPCNISLGDVIKNALFAFNSQSTVLNTTEETPYIKRKDNSLGYEILARVTNVENKLLQVGAILIELDVDFPGEVKINDCIKFTCGRLDIF
ncbi:hypothetical protein [Nostoc sp.]|uniref:hypothetical protein n=1 Tax=Nostoc sp. TaxID=1180 RepID=UPI002FF487CC